MPPSPGPLRIGAPLSSLVAGKAAIVSDVWGVVHNGVRADPAACDALSRARAAGLPVVLLSNAPRPHGSVIAQLDGLGVPREAYDAVVTSGDLTRAFLETDPWMWVHHVGPPRDAPLFEGLSLTFSEPEEADVCLVTGPFDDETDAPEDYDPLLARLLEHDVPLACANPDLVVERGDKLIPCAGAIADRYAAMGGETTYYGKPHEVAYRGALGALARVAGREIDPAHVLAIGDAVRTDLIGGRKAGMDVLFLAGGIHAKELGRRDAIDAAALEALLKPAKVRPSAVDWSLVW